MPRALLLLLLACSAPAEQGGGPPPALVEVAEATEGPLRERSTTLGDVRAKGRAELAAGAAGGLTEVRVREGDRVEHRQILALIDPDLARAELAAAEARLAATQVELARSEREWTRVQAVPDGVLAETEVDTTRTAVERLGAERDAAEAAVALARAQLERHRVRAPFAGTVSARHADAGDWVSPGSPVLDVVADGAVEVHVDVAPAMLLLLIAGQSATLTVGDESVPASVLAVVPALSTTSRTARVRLEPQGTASWLLPGATVEVALEVVRSGGVVVPRDALVLGPADPTVVTVVEGAAAPVVVQVLGTAGDQALVSGIALGTQVVTRGNERVRPGQPLTIGSLE